MAPGLLQNGAAHRLQLRSAPLGPFCAVNDRQGGGKVPPLDMHTGQDRGKSRVGRIQRQTFLQQPARIVDPALFQVQRD